MLGADFLAGMGQAALAHGGDLMIFSGQRLQANLITLISGGS